MPDLTHISDQRRPGRLFKIAGQSVGFDLIGEPSVNESKMCATAIISTPAVDRVKDSVNPRTVKLDAYKANPIVLLDHGFDYSLPVGRSETPGGSFTVKAGAKNVQATCYFHNETLEAEQVFALVSKGFLRGTSVRFGEFKAKSLRGDDGDTIQHIDDWELEEWSWTALGCNRETLTTEIGKRLCGKRLAEPILKSLQPFLIKARTHGIGFELPTRGERMVKRAKTETHDDLDITPALEDEITAPLPYGAEVATEIHSQLSDVVLGAKSRMTTLENAGLKTDLIEIVDRAEGLLAALEGAFATHYPDGHWSPTKADGPSQRDALVSLLKGDTLKRLQFAQIGHRIHAVAKTLDEKRCGQLLGVCRDMASITNAALKIAVVKPERITQPPENDARVKVISDLLGVMRDANKTIDDIRPHQSVA